MWLFKDSVQKQIDSFDCVANVRKSDILATYNYKKGIYIIIWEFKDLNSVNIKAIPFKQDVYLDEIKFPTGEGFLKNLSIFPYVKVGFKLPFEHHLQVNLNSKSEIVSLIEGSNYKGFLGKINKMSFSNGKGDHPILFDYGGRIQQTLFFFYKKNGRFFTIVVNSTVPFDERIINIFNLE